jgi:hypothetical protein
MLDPQTTRNLLNRLIDVVTVREEVAQQAKALDRAIEVMQLKRETLNEENERLLDEQLSLEKSLNHLYAVYPFTLTYMGQQYAITPRPDEIEVFPIPCQDVTAAFAVLYEGV